MNRNEQAIKAAIDTAELAPEWPATIPLVNEADAPAPYPLGALPETIRAAVKAFQEYGQQPLSLVATSSLIAVSFACQGLANVARDMHLISTTSLNSIIIAPSGERKTTADKEFMRECRAWELEQSDERDKEIAAAEKALAVYEVQRKGICSKIQKLSGDSNSKGELEKAKQALAELEKSAPHKPLKFQALYEDVNQQTLVVNLSFSHPSAALVSDEAAVVIGGNGFNAENALQFFGVLNKLWDGSRIKRNRLTAQDGDVVGRRFTVSLMMQYSVLLELLFIKKGQGRGTGFLARSLFQQPVSTMGERPYNPELDRRPLDLFHRRIRELLEMPLPIKDKITMRLEPPVLHLSPKAKQIWIAYHDAVEKELGATGEYASVADFAAKSAENAVRLAALFHVFQYGAKGEIGEAEMKSGIAIAAWHLKETRRVFLGFEENPSVTAAKILLRWLITSDRKVINSADLGQYAPNSLRKKEAWQPAVNILCEHNYLRADSKHPNTYHLNPAALEENHE